MAEPRTATCPRCGSIAVETDEPMFVAHLKGTKPERTPGTELAWCDVCEDAFEVLASGESD